MPRLLAVVVAGLFVVGAAPAVALSPDGNARVEGHWNTTIRPIELRPDGDYSVHHGIRMSYKPKCQEGPCDVILTQPTYFGDVRQTLKRDGARYSGTKTLTGKASCYGWRLTVVIRVVGVADDGVSADHLRGRSTLRGKPRRAACAGEPRRLERSAWKSRRVDVGRARLSAARG
jgi:hypothetical protein